MSRLQAITNTISREGGFSNHALDSGGKTMYGITEALARKYGYQGDMKDISLDKTVEIYTKEFWDKLRIDEINDWRIQELVFDAGVNHGGSRSILLAQRGFNTLVKNKDEIVEDGIVGSQTLGALNGYSHRYYGKDPLIDAMILVRTEFYRAIVENRDSQTVFIVGWLRRIRKLEKAIGV